MRVQGRLMPAMLWLGIVLWFGLGVLFVLSHVSLLTTPTSFFVRHLSQTSAGLLFMFCASLALVAVWYPGSIGLLMSTPTLCLFITASVSAVVAAASGQYPDGVVRPNNFILVDQFMTILAPFAYVRAMAVYNTPDE